MLIKYVWLIVFAFILFSCSKDSGSKNNDVYVVSASGIIDMAGRNWYDVKPQLKDKKDYWYTEFTQEENYAVRAAISLPALDDSNRSIHCSMLLNVRRTDSQVTSVVMGAPDTASSMSMNEAYAMMLNYHNRATKLLTQIIGTMAYYETTDGMYVNSTVNDILTKLNSGFDANHLSISYTTVEGSVSMTVFKNNATGGYSFSFTDYKQ